MKHIHIVRSHLNEFILIYHYMYKCKTGIHVLMGPKGCVTTVGQDGKSSYNF